MEYRFNDEQRAFFDQVYRFAKERLAPRSEENDLKEIFDRGSFNTLDGYVLHGIHSPD